MIPRLSCVESSGSAAFLKTLAAIAPAGARKKPGPQDRDWLPSRLTDIASIRTGFLVLDGGAGRIHFFSRDFGQRVSWGGRRTKAAEKELLGSPTALAVDPRAETVWVLDAGPPRLVAYDLRGRYQKSYELSDGGSDLAIDGKGNFYVARAVVGNDVRRDTTHHAGIAVFVYGPDGSRKAPLVRFMKKDLHLPRFNLPGFIEVRVAATADFVGVSYPASGLIDLYKNGELVATKQVCVPPSVKAAYDTQLAKATSLTRSQTSVPLISDIHIGLDGEVIAVSPLKDVRGNYHFDRFNAGNGRLVSTAFSPKGIFLPWDLYVAGRPDRLMGLLANGSVVYWEIATRVGK